MIELPVVLNYNFSKSNIIPYLGAGASPVFDLSQNKDFVYHPFFDALGSSLPEFLIGLNVKAGSKIKFNNNHGIFVELAIDQIKSLNSNQLFRFSNPSFQVNCGYIF